MKRESILGGGKGKSKAAQHEGRGGGAEGRSGQGETCSLNSAQITAPASIIFTFLRAVEGWILALNKYTSH